MGNSASNQHYETAKKTGTLTLSKKKLEELPNNALALVSFLRSLDLSENKFTKLPPEISKFTLLKTLIVNNNKLVELPEAIGSLTKLETLNASFNHISKLPSSISKLIHLKQVNLSENSLTIFPLVFCGLKHLIVLDLTKNKLTEVPNGVEELNVTELILNQNQISSISENLAICPRLKTLRMEENCLSIGAIPSKLLEDSQISNFMVEGNLFEMKQFNNLEGYDKYMERYTAVKKKMF